MESRQFERRGAPRTGTTRRIWQLAWPAILTNLLQSTVGLVGVGIVGRRLGPDALAATGIGNRIFFFQQVVLMAVTAGTTALVARAWGAGDKAEAERVTRTSLWLALALAIAFAVPSAAFADALAGIFRLDPGTHELTATFIRWISLSTPFLAASFVIGTALRAAGDTHHTPRPRRSHDDREHRRALCAGVRRLRPARARRKGGRDGERHRSCGRRARHPRALAARRAADPTGAARRRLRADAGAAAAAASARRRGSSKPRSSSASRRSSGSSPSTATPRTRPTRSACRSSRSRSSWASASRSRLRPWWVNTSARTIRKAPSAAAGVRCGSRSA